MAHLLKFKMLLLLSTFITLIWIYLVGIGFVVVGIFKLFKYKSSSFNCETTGTIIKIEESQYFNTLDNTGNIYSSIITISYMTQADDLITLDFKDTTSPSFFKKGEIVTIRYKSQNPEDFIIISRKMTLFYWSFIIVGIVICLLNFLFNKH